MCNGKTKLVNVYFVLKYCKLFIEFHFVMLVLNLLDITCAEKEHVCVYMFVCIMIPSNIKGSVVCLLLQVFFLSSFTTRKKTELNQKHLALVAETNKNTELSR